MTDVLQWKNRLPRESAARGVMSLQIKGHAVQQISDFLAEKATPSILADVPVCRTVRLDIAPPLEKPDLRKQIKTPHALSKERLAHGELLPSLAGSTPYGLSPRPFQLFIDESSERLR